VCERTEGIAVLSDPGYIGLGGVLLSKAEGRREITSTGQTFTLIRAGFCLWTTSQLAAEMTVSSFIGNRCPMSTLMISPCPFRLLKWRDDSKELTVGNSPAKNLRQR